MESGVISPLISLKNSLQTSWEPWKPPAAPFLTFSRKKGASFFCHVLFHQHVRLWDYGSGDIFAPCSRNQEAKCKDLCICVYFEESIYTDVYFLLRAGSCDGSMSEDRTEVQTRDQAWAWSWSWSWAAMFFRTGWLSQAGLGVTGSLDRRWVPLWPIRPRLGRRLYIRLVVYIPTGEAHSNI